MKRGITRGHTVRHANQLESKLQKEILKDLAARKAFSFKCLASNKRGIPDLLICIGGRFVAIELKRAISHSCHLAKSSNISALQRLTVNEICKNGGLAFFAASFDEYLYIIETLEKRLLQHG